MKRAMSTNPVPRRELRARLGKVPFQAYRVFAFALRAPYSSTRLTNNIKYNTVLLYYVKNTPAAWKQLQVGQVKARIIGNVAR